MLVVVLALAAVAAVAIVGVSLVGAIRQIDALGVTTAGVTTSAIPAVVRAAEVESAHPVPPAPSTGVPLDPDERERESQRPFDAEAAVREAGDRDSNVAELLNDPDPAVASAVRDFVTSLAPAGGN